MGARFRLIGIASQRTADWVSRVSVIIKNEIGMSARATEPAVDLVPVLFDRRPHGALGRFAIGPGGRGGDIALMT
jgi:hypothetical protein